MAWDGSGNFTRTDGTLTGPAICQTQAATAVELNAVRFDNELNNIAEGLEKCLTVTGETLPTSALNMNNQKVINVGNATASTDATNFGQMQNYSPTGSIIMYAGSTAPASGEWLLCDGTAVSRTTYAALFSVLGTTYGSGDGSTTFNVPDMRQRFPLGKAVSGTGATLGGTGGNIDHTHTGPSHTHSVPALSIPNHTHSLSSHTHTVNAHSHGAGTLHALIGGDNANQGGGLMMIPNGSQLFNPNGGYAFGASNFNTALDPVNFWGYGLGGNGSVITGYGSAAAFSTAIGGSTDNSSPATGGPSTSDTGGWSGSTGTGTTGSDGTGNTSANNPPFLTVNYLIKV